MTDRVPGAPGRYTAVVTGEALQNLQNAQPFAITLTRDDRPIKEGTPYSKAAVLPDTLAAKICPGIPDPAPKDAFGALWEQKADGIRHRTGVVVAAGDGAYAPVKELRLFGKTTQNGTPTPAAPVALERVGGSGSVEIRAFGKNLWDEQVRRGHYSDKTGQFMDALYMSSANPIRVTPGMVLYNCGPCALYTFFYDEKGTWISPQRVFNAGKDITVPQNAKYMHFNIASTYGTTYNNDICVALFPTEYEPYKESQILTVPTPGGLCGIPVSSGGNYTDANGQQWLCDEIDLARGIHVQRIGVISGYGGEEIAGSYLSSTGGLDDGATVQYILPNGIETHLLSETVKLHTYNPNTTFCNNAGAEMELVYYTPSTAVQMVHSPRDNGKILSVDAHGCVVLADAASVSNLGSAKKTFNVVPCLDDPMEGCYVTPWDPVTETGGEWVDMEGCVSYYLMVDIAHNSHLYGKTIKIKTYAYGDMAYGEEGVDLRAINPDADIVNDPVSGVCEVTLRMPTVAVSGDAPASAWYPDHYYVIPFCKNPYTDLEVYVEHETVWDSIKDLEDKNLLESGFSDGWHYQLWSDGYGMCSRPFFGNELTPSGTDNKRTLAVTYPIVLNGFVYADVFVLGATVKSQELFTDSGLFNFVWDGENSIEGTVTICGQWKYLIEEEV